MENNKKEEISNIDELILPNDINIKNEGILEGQGNPVTFNEISELLKLKKSICKITFEKIIDNEIIKGKGTGFFCEIDNYPIKYALFTNNHTLNENDIKLGKNINIEYNNNNSCINKIIKINEKRKVFTNKDLDYTCIELNKLDELGDIENYFKLDPILFNNKDNLKNSDIFVLHYPLGNDLSFSYGKILSLKNNIMKHSASTQEGSSGAPIIRRSKNNYIIGLHKGTYKTKKASSYNLAILFDSILNDIKSLINIENSNNANLKSNLNNYKCSRCGRNNANYIDVKKNDLYCQDCSYLEYIDLKKIDENNKGQADKAYFLNSMINLIKYIILECNEIIRINNNRINNKIKFSKIENIQKDYLDFLSDINISTQHKVNIDAFNLNYLEQDIKQKICDFAKRNIDIKINQIEIDDDSEGELVNEIFNENSEHSEEKEKEKNKDKSKLGEEILNDYYYFINIIPKNNSKFNEYTKKQFEDILKIKINPNNFVVSNNTKYFIDNLVRSDDILDLSLGEIKHLYPNLEELYKYKNIVDYLIKECDIKDYIDCKGNFIIKINDKDKTKEKYYPPYEWIGIGLKMRNNDDYLKNNYNDNEWAIAYHGVGGKLPINEVKDKLKTKIKNGLKQGNSQDKCNMYDIRHPGKRIGVGVYLTQNINLVENYCGIISINNEEYLVALMVKVRIDKIREPKDANIWILNNKYIRLYKILLKKIN